MPENLTPEERARRFIFTDQARASAGRGVVSVSALAAEIRAAIEAEREACAAICDAKANEAAQNPDRNSFGVMAGAEACAARIRSRGKAST